MRSWEKRSSEKVCDVVIVVKGYNKKRLRNPQMFNVLNFTADRKSL